LPRKRFTRQEVEQLLDSGFFEGQRCELIDGVLFDKMGQSPAHAAAIRRLMKTLSEIFGTDLVQSQLPIEAGGVDRDRSIPEPDVAVSREFTPQFAVPPAQDELVLRSRSRTAAPRSTSRGRPTYAMLSPGIGSST
jgi:hypothetical protein